MPDRSRAAAGWRSTTIVAVQADGRTAVGGDGQVSLGDTVLKGDASKIRRLLNGKVIVGFAGSTADAFALMERYEAKLKDFPGNTRKAAVELAKQWRTDRSMRRLEAMMISADADNLLLISGTGDVIGPGDGILAIGSGGNYALAAARALRAHTDMDARAVVANALRIAGDICVYSNQHHTIEELETAS